MKLEPIEFHREICLFDELADKFNKFDRDQNEQFERSTAQYERYTTLAGVLTELLNLDTIKELPNALKDGKYQPLLESINMYIQAKKNYKERSEKNDRMMELEQKSYNMFQKLINHGGIELILKQAGLFEEDTKTAKNET